MSATPKHFVTMLMAFACTLPAFGYQPSPQSPHTPAVAFAVSPGPGGSYLGVDASDIQPERVPALKLKDEHGVEIMAVDSDGPAAKAGFREHDVVLEYNGQRVEGAEQLRRMIHETPAGHEVTFSISRDGQPMQLKATLGDRAQMVTEYREFVRNMVSAPEPAMPPDAPELDFDMPVVDMPEVSIPPIVISPSSARTGISTEDLTPQLAQFFGVKSGKGLLVRSVQKGSPAQSAGIRAGDVIVRVNGESINDLVDYAHAIRDRKSPKVQVTVVRDKQEQTLSMVMPPANRRRGSLAITPVELARLQSDLARQLRPEIDSAALRTLQSAQFKASMEQLRKNMENFKQQLKQLNDGTSE